MVILLIGALPLSWVQLYMNKENPEKKKRSKEDKNIQLNGLKNIYGHVCNYFHK